MFCAAAEEEGEGVVENCDEAENKGVFRTGFGKKVEVKQSSIDRARAVLSELDFEDVDLGIFLVFKKSTHFFLGKLFYCCRLNLG